MILMNNLLISCFINQILKHFIEYVLAVVL